MARTGRPAEVTTDRTPFDGERVDVRARVGWLLRINRLASPDPDTRSLTVFARRLHDVGLRADAPRLSAWEQGRTLVPRRVMGGYCQVLGLPLGQLRSISDGLRCALDGVEVRIGKAAHSSLEDATLLQERLDTAYEGVAEPGTSGGQWLALAELLCEDRVALLPTRVIEPLVLQLVRETMRSVGVAYVTRFGALTRLVGHPLWHRVVTQGVRAVVCEPGAQGVVDPLSVLGEVSDTTTLHWLVGVLRDETGSMQLGAAHSVLNLLVTGRFPPAERGRLLRVLRDVRSAPLVGPIAEVVDAIMVRLNPGWRGAVAAGGVDAAADVVLPRPVLGAFLNAGRDVLPDVRDPMLERLVRESLASRFVERRHHANLLLMASPYRAAVASVAAATAEHAADPTVSTHAAALLTYVSGSGQRPTLERWLRSPRPELQHTALMSLAHGAGVAAGVDLAGMLDKRQSLAGAAVYAAGMSGHPALQVWAESDSLPLRRAARWWLDTGPAVTDVVAA